MFEVTCLDSHGKSIHHLTQWDMGQSLIIKDTGLLKAPLFHFCNRNSTKALVVPSSISSDGVITVNVPNILLKEALPIIVYMYVYENDDSAKTMHTIRIPVRARLKPSDYTYVENIEKITLASINDEIRNIQEEISSITSRTDKFTSEEAAYLHGVTSPIQEQLNIIADTKQDCFSSIINLSSAEYDQNTWYPVTGTRIPKGGLHKIHVYSTFDAGAHPSWATHDSGYTCNMEVYDKAQTWGQTDGATICTDYSWKHTSQRPCGYIQMTHSSTPVLILRGGGIYTVATDYETEWTIRTAEYTLDGDTVRPVAQSRFEFDRATIFANTDGNAASANRWLVPRLIDGLAIDGTTDRNCSGVCETDGHVAEKIVNIPGLTLVTNARIIVYFRNNNTADNPSLNVNGHGARGIMSIGKPIPTEYITENSLIEFIYRENHWHVVGGLPQAQADKLPQNKMLWRGALQSGGSIEFNIPKNCFHNEESIVTLVVESHYKKTVDVANYGTNAIMIPLSFPDPTGTANEDLYPYSNNGAAVATIYQLMNGFTEIRDLLLDISVKKVADSRYAVCNILYNSTKEGIIVTCISAYVPSEL